jgi:hypothetical protein
MATVEQATAEALILIQAQAQAREQLNQITQASVAAEIRAFAGWYDHAAITAFAGRLGKLTRASQKQMALSTDVFAVRILRLLTGRGRPVKPVAPEKLRSVPLESVYGRLADQLRYLEATRGPEAPAALLQRSPDADPLPLLSHEAILDRVVLRGELQVEDNLTLAFTNQWAADIADAPTVTGYRRVLHPELSAGGSCALCLTISDRIYSKAELLPVHERCACTVAPLIGDPEGPGDPGFRINAADLKALYAAAGGTSAAALKRVKVATIQHGELGPRLVAASHNHRTESDARRDDVIEPSAA